jgi:CheY-like chemotaxis protein
VIGGRIDALARAHDQVTRENWNAASLHELIHTEAEAYFGNNADRVVIEGPDVLLEPQAFSNVALVMHELLTNSAKYGALSDRHGQILIRLTDLADGALRLDWREKGGPPVKPPKRRGFGTTIIERSIPYELKGEASVNFEVTGLEAHFILPAPTIAEFRAVSEASRQRPAETPGAAASVSGHVLVVEDNLIIAMDAQDIFTELGADQVSVASSVAQAERLIAAHAFALAVLDINLGDETSETIADTLLAKQVPLMFATGYGERSVFAARCPDIPVIQKPYGIEEVRAALAGA